MVKTWACPDSEAWDRYAVDPESPDAAALSRHLEDCGSCRLVLAEKRKEWAALADTWRSTAGFRSIRLTAIPVSDSIMDRRPRLAAKGEPPADEAEAVTLLSPDKQVMMRAVRDQATGDLWLYLAAEGERDAPKESGVLRTGGNVLIRPFGSDREYLTDARGRVNLGKVDMPTADQLVAEVRLPTAVFRLESAGRDEERERGQTLTSPQGDEVRVTWAGEHPHRRLEVQVVKLTGLIPDAPLRIAVRGTDDARPQLKPVAGNQATVDDVAFDQPVEIYFFQ